MDIKEMCKRLESLVKLDIDASRSYKQAIDETEDEGVRSMLVQYRADHERHVDDLIALIRDMGQTPPDRSPDIKGYFIEGMTAIRSASGTEGALKAMHMNEKITNKRYSEAITWDLGPAALSIVERNYQDEQRHIRSIEQALSTRSWEKTGTRSGRDMI